MQKHDAVTVQDGIEVNVCATVDLRWQRRQLEVMRGKER